MDTFHDGEAVMLAIPFCRELTGEEDWCYIQFSPVDANWQPSSITDGWSFTAEVSNHTIVCGRLVRSLPRRREQSPVFFPFKKFQNRFLVLFDAKSSRPPPRSLMHARYSPVNSMNSIKKTALRPSAAKRCLFSRSCVFCHSLNAILTMTIFTRRSQKRIISLWKAPTS